MAEPAGCFLAFLHISLKSRMIILIDRYELNFAEHYTKNSETRINRSFLPYIQGTFGKREKP